jgi:cell division protein FtsI/penicillin-binding protein 2
LSRPNLLRAGVVVVVLGVIAAGLLGGHAPDTSAETTVQSFLLNWEEGNYQAAGQLTTGKPAVVAAALSAAFHQVDAAGLYLNIGTITQSGDSAQASFGASVDLGENGAAWTYTGRFALRWNGSAWKVRWSPSVIVPGLRPGTRLAVRSTMPPRGLVLDAAGQPLQQLSPAYVVGVRPDRLANPTATAAAFGTMTGLDSGQVLDQIRAAPQGSFLGLLTLDPRSSARLLSRLHGVPGLIVHQVRQRLFGSIASDVVGSVGTEDAVVFRQNGIPYQPGNTTGLSGLQQYYQHRLAGTPTTEVIVEDGSGHVVSVLHRWSGVPGAPVRTTLDSGAQTAANAALASTGNAAAIVAVSATGKVLAVASQPSRGGSIARPGPLAGRYPPGQAFTIVSSAALLDTGLSVRDPVPCTTVSDVGGQTFINDPPARGLGALPPFSADFAHGCGTAFAGLSRRLNAAGLSRMATGFGLGSSWRLPLPAFTGTMPVPANDAQLAADTLGAGNVQVSPLNMALIAGQVDSGQWHSPSLVSSPADPAADPPMSSKYLVSQQVMGTLRNLMRQAVQTGAARQADVRGLPVYGQTGQAPFSAGGKGVRAAWFVGFRGNVAFAVLELGTARSTSAVPLAAQFLQRLPSSLLGG